MEEIQEAIVTICMYTCGCVVWRELADGILQK